MTICFGIVTIICFGFTSIYLHSSAYAIYVSAACLCYSALHQYISVLCSFSSLPCRLTAASRPSMINIKSTNISFAWWHVTCILSYIMDTWRHNHMYVLNYMVIWSHVFIYINVRRHSHMHLQAYDDWTVWCFDLSLGIPKIIKYNMCWYFNRIHTCYNMLWRQQRDICINKYVFIYLYVRLLSVTDDVSN